ncbi:MAG: Fic family protein [Acidimicrobiales bacterium]
MQKVLAARAIQGSNSIEGYNVSVEDAVAAIEGNEPREATGDDWAAVASYRRAMTFVLQLARSNSFQHSGATLQSLHFMMTEYDLDASPGLWRSGPIWIQNELSGDIVYEGPDHEQLPDLIDSLVEQLDSALDESGMIRGAMAHLNLVMIHPFRDGNGRMARCLQTLVLAREGILVPEFCSSEEYLGRNTQAYYDVLANVGQGRWNPGNDARPWIRYCLRAHYVQAASVLRRVRESEKIWGFLEDTVAAAGIPERAIEALFDASLGMRVTNSSYRTSVKRSDHEISKQTATTDLAQMVKANLLEKQGSKRGTSYVGSSELVAFYADLRRQRTSINTEQLFEP